MRAGISIRAWRAVVGSGRRCSEQHGHTHLFPFLSPIQRIFQHDPCRPQSHTVNTQARGFKKSLIQRRQDPTQPPTCQAAGVHGIGLIAEMGTQGEEKSAGLCLQLCEADFSLLAGGCVCALSSHQQRCDIHHLRHVNISASRVLLGHKPTVPEGQACKCSVTADQAGPLLGWQGRRPRCRIIPTGWRSRCVNTWSGSQPSSFEQPPPFPPGTTEPPAQSLQFA